MPMSGKPMMGPNPKPMRTPARMVFAWLVASICITKYVLKALFSSNSVGCFVGLTGGVPPSDLWQGMETLGRAADL